MAFLRPITDSRRALRMRRKWLRRRVRELTAAQPGRNPARRLARPHARATTDQFIYPFYPDSHTPLIWFPGGVVSRARGQELGKRKHQEKRQGVALKRKTTRTATCTTTILMLRFYFCLAIVSTHSTRRDATPSASHCSSDTLPVPLRRAMAAPRYVYKVRCNEVQKLGKGWVGWWRRAYTAHRVKETETKCDKRIEIWGRRTGEYHWCLIEKKEILLAPSRDHNILCKWKHRTLDRWWISLPLS